MGVFEWAKSRFLGKNKLKLSESIPYVFGQLKESRRESYSTGGAYQRYVKSLIELVGDHHVGEYTPEMIEQWFDFESNRVRAGGGKLSKSSLSTAYYVLKGYFQHLCKMGHIQSNPCQMKVETPPPSTQPRERVDPEDVARMIDSMHSVRDRAIVRILFDSGSRPNELRLLKLSSTSIVRYYKVGKKSVVVSAGDAVPAGVQLRYAGASLITRPKRKQGHVKFRHDACLDLLRWLKLRPEPKPEFHDYIWITSHRNVMSRTRFAGILSDAGKRVGADISNARAYRHWRAYKLRKEGYSEQVASSVLNNSQQTVARIYQLLSKEEELEEFISLDGQDLPYSDDDELSNGLENWL